MDRTETGITYEILLDENLEQIEEVRVTVLTAARSTTNGRVDRDEHIAFHTVYRLEDHGDVEPFEVPREAIQLLR